MSFLIDRLQTLHLFLTNQGRNAAAADVARAIDLLEAHVPVEKLESRGRPRVARVSP